MSTATLPIEKGTSLQPAELVNARLLPAAIVSMKPWLPTLTRLPVELDVLAEELTSAQDSGRLAEMQKRKRYAQFYKSVRTQFCKDFSPMIDRRDPTYWHTHCASGLRSGKPEFAPECGACQLRVAEDPGFIRIRA